MITHTRRSLRKPQYKQQRRIILLNGSIRRQRHSITRTRLTTVSRRATLRRPITLMRILSRLTRRLTSLIQQIRSPLLRTRRILSLNLIIRSISRTRMLLLIRPRKLRKRMAPIRRITQGITRHISRGISIRITHPIQRRIIINVRISQHRRNSRITRTLQRRHHRTRQRHPTLTSTRRISHVSTVTHTRHISHTTSHTNSRIIRHHRTIQTIQVTPIRSMSILTLHRRITSRQTILLRISRMQSISRHMSSRRQSHHNKNPLTSRTMRSSLTLTPSFLTTNHTMLSTVTISHTRRPNPNHRLLSRPHRFTSNNNKVSPSQSFSTRTFTPLPQQINHFTFTQSSTDHSTGLPFSRQTNFNTFTSTTAFTTTNTSFNLTHNFTPNHNTTTTQTVINRTP